MWNLNFLELSKEESCYRKYAIKIDESLLFIKSIVVDTSTSQFIHIDLFMAYEFLLLPHEQFLTYQYFITGKRYDLLSHMLWLGYRTCEHD